MIALESLSCFREPQLLQLSLQVLPGELPAVVSADADERAALVELLAGYRPESEGAFVLDGQVLPAKARRAAVVVLPHKAALTPDLSVNEHLRLLARLRGARADAGTLKSLLAFSRIESGRARPEKLQPEQQLRLTVALAVVGRPALVVALDPPKPVAELLPELRSPDRALLLVTEALQGMEGQVTHVHGMRQGRLESGIAGPAAESPGQLFMVRVTQGSGLLETMLATQVGVSLERLSAGSYRMRVQDGVAVAPLIRSLVGAGVTLEQITIAGPGRRGQTRTA